MWKAFAESELHPGKRVEVVIDDIWLPRESFTYTLPSEVAKCGEKWWVRPQTGEHFITVRANEEGVVHIVWYYQDEISGVRPVIAMRNANFGAYERFTMLGRTWITLDEGTAITENCIGTTHYDSAEELAREWLKSSAEEYKDDKE